MRCPRGGPLFWPRARHGCIRHGEPARQRTHLNQMLAGAIDDANQDFRQNSVPAMTRDDMRRRTKAYANRIVRLCEALPDRWVARTLGSQLLWCGTSVGVNYRAVCRAKSRADFINKLRIVEEECDESLFWMELLVENNLINPGRLDSLMKEGSELVAIVVASAKTSRARAPIPNPKSQIPNRK